MRAPVQAAARAKAKIKAKAKAMAARLKAKADAAKAKDKIKALAKSKYAKVHVFKGKITKTGGGLKQGDLVKGCHGKIVSAKRQALHKNNKWARATSQARKALGITGWQLCKKGTAFYNKTREIWATL